MPVAGYEAASLYGYSTARVKAMESKMIRKEVMQSIINAKDIPNMLSILVQTDYKRNLEEYGGVNIKSDMIDFALSKNLGNNVDKLITIAPIVNRGIVRAIAGKWDMYNIKLAIEAKEKGASFADISKYVIDYGTYNSTTLKELMNEPNIESMINRAMINSPYRKTLAAALETYRKEKSALSAAITIDKLYYEQMGSIIIRLIDMHHESAQVIKADMDMRNLLMLIRAKRHEMKFADFGGTLIEKGSIKVNQLRELYEGAKDLESMIKEIKVFDLSEELGRYKANKRKELLIFEMGMKNSIFNKSIKLLKHSVLSIGTIIAYAYLKEIEVFTLRIIIKGKTYGLGREELAKMMVWKAE
ncbi:MAG: V-type ATPase subunit [Candidatus Micrarchaeota archaeon]|nr:V-type ATPase subunit [Candidatus Micrarchaeota archaeon]